MNLAKLGNLPGVWVPGGQSDTTGNVHGSGKRGQSDTAKELAQVGSQLSNAKWRRIISDASSGREARGSQKLPGVGKQTQIVGGRAVRFCE